MAATASTSRLQASDLYDPAGAPSLSDGYPGQSRSGRQHDERRERRPSPSYDGRNGDAGGNERNNWRRLTPERGLEPQSQQPDSNGRGYNGNAGYRRGGYSNGAGNADFFAQRRNQRDTAVVSIWPTSPRTPDNSDSEDDDKRRRKRKKEKKDRSSKHSKSSKRRRYSSASEAESDDDERRDRSRRKSERDSERDRDSKRSSRRHRGDDSASDHDKSAKRSRRSDSPPSSAMHRDRVHNEQEDEWTERPSSSMITADKHAPPAGEGRLAVAAAPADRVKTSSTAMIKSSERPQADDSDDDDDDVGPKPFKETDEQRDAREYGGALLRGEGEAMAAYVTEGKRIPRRGEIGLESTQIEKFESAGYVMSGSRHRRMNAVRIRKENQVISAEEKRGILKLQKEEKNKKEAMVVGSFKELFEHRLESEKRNAKYRETD